MTEDEAPGTGHHRVREELRALLDGALLDPLRALGPGAVDEVLPGVEHRISVLAAGFAGDLDHDGAAGREAAERLLAVLERSGQGPEWWDSEAGRVLARRAAALPDVDRAVRAVDAARMLGVDRSRVYELRSRQGVLDPHPDGGITLRSVLRRLGGLPPA